jgi:hypothetical protein
VFRNAWRRWRRLWRDGLVVQRRLLGREMNRTRRRQIRLPQCLPGAACLLGESVDVVPSGSPTVTSPERGPQPATNETLGLSHRACTAGSARRGSGKETPGSERGDQHVHEEAVDACRIAEHRPRCSGSGTTCSSRTPKQLLVGQDTGEDHAKKADPKDDLKGSFHGRFKAHATAVPAGEHFLRHDVSGLAPEPQILP